MRGMPKASGSRDEKLWEWVLGPGGRGAESAKPR